MPIKKRQIEHLVLIGVGITFAMLIALSGLAWHSVEQADEANVIAGTTEETLQTLEQVLQKADRVEAAQRALLSENTVQKRNERQAAIDEMHNSIVKAMHQIGHDSRQLARLENLMQSIAQHSDASGAAQHAVLAEQEWVLGKNQFDLANMKPVRNDLEWMMATHNNRLRERMVNELAEHQRTYSSFALMLGVLSLTAGYLFVRIRSVTRRCTEATTALQRSEARYRSIVETANEGICMINENGRFTLANERLAQMFGCAQHDFIDRSIFDFMDDSGQVKIGPVLGRCRAGLSSKGEFSFRHVDGSEIWVLLSTQPFNCANGQYGGALAMFSDITERKNAEEALRRSHDELESKVRQRYADLMDLNATLTCEVAERQRTEVALQEAQRFARSTMDAVQAYITVLDENGTILTVNRAAREFASEYAPGANFLALCRSSAKGGGSGLADLAETITSVIKGPEQAALLELPFERNGPLSWMWGRVSRFGSGGALRIVVVLVDITERKEAETALRESQERFQSLAAMSSDWFWEQDTDFRFTELSGGGVACGEFAVDHMIGKTRWELGPANQLFDWAEHRSALKTRQAFSNFEYRYFDGKQDRWFSINGAPVFDAHGLFKGYRGTGRDITERKRIEEVLRQSQEALRQLAAHQERIKEEERKRIAREIHDELGSVLTGIKAYISVVIDRAERTGNQPDALLPEAVKLSEHAIATVRRVIADLRPSMLDQLGIWAALESHAERIGDSSGLQCQYLVDPKAEALQLSPERSIMLFRIVQEALTNTVRHAGATHVTIRAYCTESFIMVEIADNGKGIKPEHLRNHESWGVLGMYERAHHFGGELKITGNEGQGTVVALRLPLENLDG